MSWGTRAKRHGGAQFIAAKRARQVALLQKEDQEDEIVRGAWIFLNENTNRVLGREVEEHFGWPKLR